MTYREILETLNTLPNYSDPPENLSAEDRAWLCEFRLRFASGGGASAEEEEHLQRIVKDCS